MDNNLVSDILKFRPSRIIMALALLAPAAAQARHHHSSAIKHDAKVVAPPPALPNLVSYIVAERQTGRVIGNLAEQQDLIRRPASLTKLMTAWCAFDALAADAGKPLAERVFPQGLDTELLVSRNAAGKSWNLGLKAGGHITLRQALLAMMVQSKNDAATIVGEKVASGNKAAGRSEDDFTVIMNQQAHGLKMYSTTFATASGQDEFAPNRIRTNLTTASDIVTLIDALYSRFGEKYGEFLHPAGMNIHGHYVQNIEKDILNHTVGRPDAPLKAIMVKGGINIGGHDIAMILHDVKANRDYTLVVLGEKEEAPLHAQYSSLLTRLDQQINGPLPITQQARDRITATHHQRHHRYAALS